MLWSENGLIIWQAKFGVDLGIIGYALYVIHSCFKVFWKEDMYEINMDVGYLLKILNPTKKIDL